MTQQIAHYASNDWMLWYLLHLPPDSEAGTRMPLILFLHGIGERGADINLLKQHGIPRVVEAQPAFPFITLSPQCPDGVMWTHLLPKLSQLLDHALSVYPVDASRVYLTGLSMGGYGAWHLAAADPERFAAVAPICGGGDPATVCRLKNTPVWAFHGEKDNVVLLRESRRVVDALRECGGNVRFTIYKNAGHDVWTRTYEQPRLYDWLLSHRRAAVPDQ